MGSMYTPPEVEMTKHVKCKSFEVQCRGCYETIKSDSLVVNDRRPNTLEEFLACLRQIGYRTTKRGLFCANCGMDVSSIQSAASAMYVIRCEICGIIGYSGPNLESGAWGLGEKGWRNNPFGHSVACQPCIASAALAGEPILRSTNDYGHDYDLEEEDE